MLEKLDFLVEKYKQLNEKISDPDIIADQPLWQKYIKEHAGLEPIVLKYNAYKAVKDALDETEEIVRSSDDEELREMAKMELPELEERYERMTEEIKFMLIPSDPNDDKNVIVEVRAGAGGDEAGLFATEIFRMYARYAERNHWKIDIMNTNETGVGGFKEIVFMIKGKGAYSKLKYESGVHRVQRIPQTESGGRIHTSTVTVAVLAEADDVEVEINPNEIRVDVFRSSGNGGQSVNTTDSAVRITHLPTGLVVTCQDEKSQLKNKTKALKVLKARLYDAQLAEQNAEIADARKTQVGTGERSEKIRTYNYPQSRVTDHRINLTLYKLTYILDGDLDEIIDSLTTEDQAAKLKKLS